MKSTGRIHFTAVLMGIVGAALFIFLIASHGVTDVIRVITAARWSLLAVVLWHLAPLFLDAIAWQVLFPPPFHIRLGMLFWIRWMGEAINTLLPTAHIGGDIVRARLLTISGVPAFIAAASVLVDVTIGVFVQALVTIAGFALLAGAMGHAIPIGSLVMGVVLSVAAVGGFYMVQRLGIFRLLGLLVSRLAGSAGWHSLVQNGEAFDHAVRDLYARRRAVLICCIGTVASFTAGAGEVWIALAALGAPSSFIKAFIIESMAQGIRGAMFLVPGALGVQEGGYLVVGHLLGIPGDTALALALVRRVRELSFGIPGLIGWQIIEGHRAWRRRAVEGN